MDIKKVITNFERNRYQVSYFETSEQATNYLNTNINQQYVGFGDSNTLTTMNLYETLSTHNHVIDPGHCINGNDFKETAKECLTTDIFITSVNAATELGELINIDGTGNRIAGSLFGHDKVYFVIGINKFAPTLEEALWRARNVAAPLNAKRLNLRTPCAIKGDRCYDCASPDRICNGIMIYHKKMHDIDMEIVIVNQKLGF